MSIAISSIVASSVLDDKSVNCVLNFLNVVNAVSKLGTFLTSQETVPVSGLISLTVV